MEEARKKLRVCLICVVAVAVVVGVVYYFHDLGGGKEVSEGTLITITSTVIPGIGGGAGLWQ